MSRLLQQDFGASCLDTSGHASTALASIPFTFSQNGFSIAFFYKSFRNSINEGPATGGSAFASNEGWFVQSGSIILGRQGTNDMQMYAFLNAPTDFATPRRLRFGGFRMPNTDRQWHLRVYNVYIVSGSGKVDEYEDGVKLGSTHTVNYTGDATTPSGSLSIGNALASFFGLMDNVRIWNDRVLSVEEQLAMLSSGAIPATADLEILFNELTGSSAANTGSTSGTNPTATLSGGAVFNPNVFMRARGIA